MFLILFISCAVLFLTYYCTKNYNYWKKKNITQVNDVMWSFMFGKQSMGEIYKNIYDNYDVPHIGTTMGLTPALMIKEVEDIQAVFAGDFKSFYNRGVNTNSNDILADNLLFTNDIQRWRIMRQKLTPVFTSSKLKNMFYIMEKCARDFVDLVENDKKLRETPFNVLYTYTTASIGAAVFGIDTQTKTTMDSPFLEMSWKSVKPTLKFNLTIALSDMFPKIFNLMQLKFFGDHEDFFIGAVKSVLASRKQSNETNRHDFIEVCLELQKTGMMKDPTTGYELYPSDEMLAAQAFFFFLAGADTSANTMHFTLLELSSNPKILGKLHNEIDNIFDSHKKELTYNDIENMQYLDMVLSEAMRKYPSNGFLQRVCTNNTVLPSNVKIEKDTVIVIPVYAIHRDEKHYPNPEKFDPERFRSGNVANVKKFTYLPFGEGNRICIGNRFARLQVKVALAWLLRRYTLGEQDYSPKIFEKSAFALRDPEARYELIRRNV